MNSDISRIVDRYPITVFWSEEDGSYIAVATDFAGHSAHGDTPEEAVGEARIALAAFVESYLEHADLLPEPSVVTA